MKKYMYMLKDSAKKDKMIISGVELNKEEKYISSTKLDFGKFNSLILEYMIELIDEPENNVKKKENEIIKKMDLTKVSKNSLIKYIIQNTNDLILQDKNLLISLKKIDLIDIVTMIIGE